MSTTFYKMTIEPLHQRMKNLRHILALGQKHAEENGYESERLTSLRLFPDMLPLHFQVYIATDLSKGAVKRLTDIEVPVFEDVETSFEDLIARVEKTIAILESVTPESINGQEEKGVVLKLRSGDLNFAGDQYVLHFLIPNVDFHITTTYAILRSNGVVLGKRDYLGGE